jgi:hypothetical protein
MERAGLRSKGYVRWQTTWSMPSGDEGARCLDSHTSAPSAMWAVEPTQLI